MAGHAIAESPHVGARGKPRLLLVAAVLGERACDGTVVCPWPARRTGGLQGDAGDGRRGTPLWATAVGPVRTRAVAAASGAGDQETRLLLPTIRVLVLWLPEVAV